MVKSLRDIPEFYEFTDVYKPRMLFFRQPDEYYTKRHEAIIQTFDELAAQGVTSVMLEYALNFLKCSVDVRIYEKQVQRNDLKQLYFDQLEEFILKAAQEYHPNCGDGWGGEWMGWIRFLYNPELEVEVTRRNYTNTEPEAIVSDMTTFRAKL
jgi:hypothetical protein